MQALNNFDEYYKAVDEIHSYLKRDLIGFVEEAEVLENVEPLNVYASGILWPHRLQSTSASDEVEEAGINAQEDDTEEPEDAIAIFDDSISKANVYKPTSMGVTLTISEKTEILYVSFSGAKYTHEEERIEIESIDKKTGEKTVKPRTVHRYKRTPFIISQNNYEQAKITIDDHIGTKTIINEPELNIRLTFTLRSIMEGGSKLVTITAQNTARAKQKGVDQSINSLFQCELAVSSDVAFLPVYLNNPLINDDEEKIGNLQYRNVKNYAYGHGCSTAYSETLQGIFEVKSDFMPKELVFQMMAGEIKNKNVLSLAYWETVKRDTAYRDLGSFINEYVVWRGEQLAISTEFKDKNYKEASEIVIARIEDCINRLKSGVEILKQNDNAWNAFILMNRAMLQQRVKTKSVDERTVNWYPFQIAYILQVIPDIVDSSNEYRNSVDLLWFPTGGGKTEAYLGVAAFAIFYRRLIGEVSSDGVTVIMRYTLRLLTMQQFERATALICACELIRKETGLSGGEINIGLWIGSSMTPNRLEQAKEVLDKLNENPRERVFEGNPVQITKCPWCGTGIDLNGYSISENGMIIRCADNPDCKFHKSLPVYVVDEDIYRVRPTLLLSTIDKFARIAWEESTRNLFGDNCPPPELIIQDELHLISGPLGSLSGIYEIAIEYLCGRDSKSPKIIASTATVRNANEQIYNLYNKKMIQFPPAGINYDDSFFAIKADASMRPARTYVGLCEMGGSIADLLIRVYATLFFTKTLFKKQGKNRDVVDQYFTTVGYFNALKDLGASSTIIQDRIYTHIRNIVYRTFRHEAEAFKIKPADVRVFENSELTSRKGSKEIKETLDNLALCYDEHGSYSYVLASNMLSVGIDIDRLGVMTVYNQPKSNAEYIQATSRVGRRNPGIVLAMYNNMRSRDKSHYEQFGYYHRSFYRYVEATSVTPFSLRAIEKALHCVFVAMVRLTIPGLTQNASARHFSSDDGRVKHIFNYIVGRVEEIMPRHAEFASDALHDFIEYWDEVATAFNNTLCYKSINNPSLLFSAEEETESDTPKILNSLRNVEQSSNVYFKR